MNPEGRPRCAGRGAPCDNVRMSARALCLAACVSAAAFADADWRDAVDSLAGPDPAARDAAFDRVALSGLSGAEAVGLALLHDDPAIAALAPRLAAAVARHAPPADRPALAARLLAAAVDAARGDAPPEAGPGLAGLFEAARAFAARRDEDAARHDAARGVIHTVGATADAALAPALADLLGHPPLADAALDALARIPDAGAALRAALDLPDPRLRGRAAAMIAGRGDPADAALLAARGEAAAAAALGLADPPRDAAGVTLAIRAAQVRAARGDRSGAEQLATQALDQAVHWAQARSALLVLAEAAPAEAARRAAGYAATPEMRGVVVGVLARDNAPGAEDRIARAYARAAPAARVALLEALARRGSPRAAALAAEARRSDDAELRLAATAILGGAPDDNDLLAAAATARQGGDAALRALLDRAHALALSGDAAAAAERFRAVLDTPAPEAARAEALEGLGACGAPGDRPLLEAALDHAGLRPAAHRALAAHWAAQPDHPEARDALADIAARGPDDAAALAFHTLARRGDADPGIPARRGWVAAWRVAGPVPVDAANPLDAPGFDAARAEDARAEDAPHIAAGDARHAWRLVETDGIPAVATAPGAETTDTGAALETDPEDAPAATPDAWVWCAAARVSAAAWTPAHLHLEVDGPFQALLNGAPVARVDAPGPARERAAVRLRPGVNRLVLLLAGDPESPPRLAARFTTRRDAPIDLAAQSLPDDGLAGTGIAAPALIDDGLP